WSSDVCSSDLEPLNSASDKIDKFLKTAAPRMGKGRSLKEVKSNITDNQSAKMTTSKGTIQGYNGVAAVDKKHQIIIEAQAFGEGQEHHTLQPVAELIKQRYQRLRISKNIYATGTVLTADTGFANEANMQYLHDQDINAYVPDNQFRSRSWHSLNMSDYFSSKISDNHRFETDCHDPNAKSQTDCLGAARSPFQRRE